MNERQRRGQIQYEISQKRINALAAWLDENSPGTRDQLCQEFIQVYKELLSSLGKGQKSAPADLYKLDSYWSLQQRARELLEAFGTEVNDQFNEQLRLTYIDIYEGCRPEEPRACMVSDRVIQAAINKARGKMKRTNQERVWMLATILWDKLFGELMHCTIKHLTLDELEGRLHSQFNATNVALKTAFSDGMTYIQTRAIAKRSADDRTMTTLVTTSEEEDIPQVAMMSARGIFDNEGEDLDDDFDSDVEAEDGDEETTRFYLYAELDDLSCQPCIDLDGMLWDEDIYGDVPIPVHPNCRCWVEEAPGNPFDELADSIADAGAGSFSGMLFSMAIIGVLTIAGRLWDDLLTGSMSPGEWLAKWGDKYPV